MESIVTRVLWAVASIELYVPRICLQDATAGQTQSGKMPAYSLSYWKLPTGGEGKSVGWPWLKLLMSGIKSIVT